MSLKSPADEVTCFVVTPLPYIIAAIIFLLIFYFFVPKNYSLPPEFQPYTEKIGNITNFDIVFESSLLSSTTHCLVEVNYLEKYIFNCHADDLATSLCLYRYHGYSNYTELRIDTC
jgi:hypothetical protein